MKRDRTYNIAYIVFETDGGAPITIRKEDDSWIADVDESGYLFLDEHHLSEFSRLISVARDCDRLNEETIKRRDER